MKLTKLFIFCVSSLLFSIYGNAQDIVIKGKVIDEKGMPISGASILINGTKTSTSTDFDGSYSIKTPSDGTLVASFIGYKPETVAVGGKTTINFNLAPESQILNTVVIVAYGSQKRAKVTGAISTVSSKDIAAVPITNAESALQGRAAGVTVVTGAPGTIPRVTIRGLGTMNNNNPLYVIDGVTAGNLSGLSPNDIESMSVLKDASTAALYGSQGFNGVIIVTTKKGKKGAGQLNFSTYTGAQSVSKRYDVLNTNQYKKYAIDLGVDVSGRIAKFGNINTNWQDQIFQTGLMQDYNLSFSSGGENSTSRYSAEYLKQEGAVISTGFERYSFRANNTFNLGKINVGSNIGVSFSKRNPERSAGGRTLIEHAIKSAPYLPVYNGDNLGGYQGPSKIDGQDAENPVRVQNLGGQEIEQLSLLGNIYGEYEIFKGLKFRSQASLDYYTGEDRTFIPSFLDSDTHGQGFSTSVRNYTKGQTLVLNNGFIYKNTFGEKHNFDAVALIEKSYNKSQSLVSNSRFFISDKIDQLGNVLPSMKSRNNEYNRLSYVGRVNYDYDEKYLLSASIRRDQSSKFAIKYREGYFYSGALGWNIAKEAFMENTAFSTLKLRASVGTTGNDLIDDYQSSATLGIDYLYPIAGSSATGVSLGKLANPELKWESKLGKNYGLDFGLFGDKITGSIEYFDNKSSDILFDVPLPASKGTTTGSQFQNIATVNTKGYELSLGYNDNKGDFTWSANLNFGTSKNEVTYLADNTTSVLSGPVPRAGLEQFSRISVGDPLFYMYGLVTDGIYQNQTEVDKVLFARGPETKDPNTNLPIPGPLLNNSVKPGDIRFKDLNGDGFINEKDKTKIGNQFPDFTYGLNLTAAYKNLDFSCFITGVKGNSIFNASVFDLQGMQRLFNVSTAVIDRANVVNNVVTNPSATIPRALGATQNVAISDRYVEDGSFTRLKNITLGYTFKGMPFTKYISKLRLYASAQNMITITKYSGLDPEIGGAGFNAGLDLANYPQPKSVIFGLEVAF
jgi:TonB-dependent starch-binding outer membrane protein SusC